MHGSAHISWGSKYKNVFMLGSYSVKYLWLISVTQIILMSVRIRFISAVLAVTWQDTGIWLVVWLWFCALIGWLVASVWLIQQTLVWFVWHLGVIICKCLDDGRGSGRVWLNWHIKHEQRGDCLTRKLQDVTNDEQWCDALIILVHCCWIIITLAPNSSYYIQI